MLIELLKCLDQASDRDEMCYDKRAAIGEFTRHLLVIMKFGSVKGNDFSPLDKIYVSRNAFRQIFSWSSNPDLDSIVNTCSGVHDESQYDIDIMGMQIKICDDLDYVWDMDKLGQWYESYGNLRHFWDEQDCVLAYNDKELVIGVSNDHTNIIVGSF